MYTGTLIEQLIATVERAEQRSQESADSIELDRLSAMNPYQVSANQPALLGVA
ncbi:MAG: hypothetical protein LAO03_02760 [Acidobacteriia bacterium]|nr:hypothetical protein [Terriglobia bacterium]